MKSSRCITLVLVSFLLAIVLHEGSAELSSYQRKIFRARQAEARRNRIKFEPESGPVPMFTGFLLKNGYTKFVLPELSNDKNLVQTFKLPIEPFQLVCRKREQAESLVTQQRSALNTLKRGKAYFYEPITRNQEHDFVFIPAPLTNTEKSEIVLQKGNADHLCGLKPMPGLQPVEPVKSGSVISRLGDRSIKYVYGEDKNSCHYYEFGIETLSSQNDDSESKRARAKKQSSWARLFSLCHDATNMVTAFTKHTINWDHLIHRKLNPNVQINREEEKIFVDPDMDKFYDLDNQRISFHQNEFRAEKEAFDKESNYLVRVHLVPDYDTLYESWQYITGNYLNYAPQWRSTNLGQWLKVEQDIRNVALKLQKNLTIYTGVYYRKNSARLIIPVKENFIDAMTNTIIIIKKDESTSSKKKEEAKSIPIPSLFYKYVHSDMAGIVIITTNGVSGSTSEIKCTDVCELYGWMYTDAQYTYRNNASSGQTKCCTPDDFFNQKEVKNSLPPLPTGIEARSKILTFHGREVNVKEPGVQEEAPEEAGTRVFVAGSSYNFGVGDDMKGNSYVIGAD